MTKKKQARFDIKNPVFSHTLFVLFISLFPLAAILINQDFFWTQDGWTHLARTGSYAKGLLDGQMPVRWAGDLNYSYGLPLFNFVFQTPYFFMALLTILGFGLVSAFKTATAITFLMSGFFMFLFAYAFFKDLKKAITVTIFYQFFPFHLVDMTVRGSIGELFAFAFLPLGLFAVTKYLDTKNILFLYLTALATALLALSHLATGALFIGVTTLFAAIFAKDKKIAVFAIGSILVGLLLSAYYWIPALLEHRYTYGNLFARDLYKEHFAPAKNIFSPNIFNSESLRTGNVPVHLGIIHIAVTLLAGVSIFKDKKLSKKLKKLFLLNIFFTLVALFFMSRASAFIWESIPTFRQFQFPWRFLSLLSISTSLVSISLFQFRLLQKKYMLITILFVTIASTAFLWVPQEGYREINEDYYWNYPLNTTYFGETDLRWSAGPASKYPDKPVEAIEGSAVISDFYKKSNLHTYSVSSTQGARLVDRTQYYPGWIVEVNDARTDIQFQDPNYPGLITFDVPEGQNSIEVRFTENKTRKLANSISVLTIVTGILLFFFLRFKRK